MLILDKPRALDRMLYLSDWKANAIPSDFLLPSQPLRWIATPAGGRSLAGELVLRPTGQDAAPIAEGVEALAG